MTKDKTKPSIGDYFGKGNSSKHPESCSAFVSRLFKAKEDAHITHIEQRTKSFAIHEALGTFYTSLDGLLDTFAETVMAIHGQLTISFSSSVISDPMLYMEALYKEVDKAKTMYNETWILNQIDEMQQLIAHTLYRLKFVTAQPMQ